MEIKNGGKSEWKGEGKGRMERNRSWEEKNKEMTVWKEKEMDKGDKMKDRDKEVIRPRHSKDWEESWQLLHWS